MKFTKIFSEALRFRPHEIDISDGELRGGSGGYFPTLSRAWDVAEKHSKRLSEFHQTMVWAIFCGLHKKAVSDLRSGGRRIRKVHLDLVYVEQKFSESALNGGRYYKQVRNLYVNDLPPATVA
ncbi:hypothetical protein KW842_03980 [Duganella sp. sic0402]|uniref:hypothetical protein n=1 Tax=Duganella sp. sic0402 TaxID=2854786 RepID=UPI001C4804FF|nr:hypothetical protein [Duganella sp. sic0402]MBV7534922.1 hypothetical protein [Duganella sp. sic0402]